MAQFHQHPDNLVYVRVGALSYCDTPVNFACDLNETVPALPAGMVERIYDDTFARQYHRVFNAEGDQLDGGPVPRVCELAIARIEGLLRSQAKRNAPTPDASRPLPKIASVSTGTNKV